MGIEIKPGRYVVAVSGGVDSMVLLDILSKQPGVELVVAHFDHGIRPESAEDRKYVQTAALRYKIPFVYDRAELGPRASEALAREARYGFLHKVRDTVDASAIATAHHEDDVLETAIINMVRGSGRKGLSSLHSTDTIVRPLLHLPKHVLIAYAVRHSLPWREDPTNKDTAYLRNYVRHKVLPQFDESDRSRLLQLSRDAAVRNASIDNLLSELIEDKDKPALERLLFMQLPHVVAKELLAAFLRLYGIHNFDRKLLEQIVIRLKTLSPGKRIDVDGEHVLTITKEHIMLRKRKSV